MHTRTLLVALSLLAATPAAFPQDAGKPSGKLSGYLFGDYYYMVGADTAARRGNAQYAATPKDMQGFQFRRLYVIYDQPLSEKFAMQTILEGTDKSLDPGGRFGVYVKTAFLEWRDIVPMGNFRIGLIPTLTWTNSEAVWNYRALEKTVTDMRGLGQATDLGVSLRGACDAEGRLAYGVMISNGGGIVPEVNKYKKFSAELLTRPVKNFSLELNADYEPGKNDTNKTTVKALAAYRTEPLTVGVEFVQQTQAKMGPAGADAAPRAISLFAWAPIPGVERLNAIVRYDLWDPDTKVSDAGFTETFLVAGVDYMPISSVHLMPNIWVDSYHAKSGSVTRDADVAARVTFWYSYK